jgi:hypothetical protein
MTVNGENKLTYFIRRTFLFDKTIKKRNLQCPLSRDLLDKLVISQLVKKFPVSEGTQTLIIVLSQVSEST